MGEGTEDCKETSFEQLFLDEWPMIQRLLASVARQHRMSPEDAEEFVQQAVLRIIDDDYAVLRKFGGRCALRTYLTVVLQRMYLDFRVAQWGKWRPSAVSMRAGQDAVLMERLTLRDGLTFEEACAVLEINHGLTIERDTLARIHAAFRGRQRPRFVSEAELGETPARDRADGPVAKAMETQVLRQALDALQRVLGRLEQRDRLFLEMRFAEGMTVADVARTLKVDQRWLYRHYVRLLRELRTALEAEDVHGEALSALLGDGEVDADGALAALG